MLRGRPLDPSAADDPVEYSFGLEGESASNGN